MVLAPGLRKLALTAHVTTSVGWLGAVAAFLVLSVAGLRSEDPQIARSAYVAMGLTAWYLILPLCLASLATGLVQSLVTPWGLFRHYWVLIKFLITVLSTLILFVHMRPITYVAGVAASGALAAGDLRRLRIQLAADAAFALVALLVNTVLSIYKPRGLTRYGWRKQREERARPQV